MDATVIQLIIQEYNSGKGTNQISKELKLHRSTIQKYLILNNIKLRKRSPQCNYNINFFSTYNKESCYWAGFLMADGYLRDRTLELKLAVKDKSHLEKFMKCIKSNGKVYTSKNSYSYVCVKGQWFYKDLINNFNVVPCKTFITKFPMQMPKEYYNDFIRGYLDGDGTITHTSCPTIGFIGTTELLNIFTKYFKELGVKLKSGNEFPPLQISNKNIGSIYYSGKNAKLILDNLYSNSNSELRLDRKYQKYIDLFCKV